MTTEESIAGVIDFSIFLSSIVSRLDKEEGKTESGEENHLYLKRCFDFFSLVQSRLEDFEFAQKMNSLTEKFQTEKDLPYYFFINDKCAIVISEKGLWSRYFLF